MFNFFFKVASVIAVLHEQHDFLFILSVVVQLDYVVVFQLGVDYTLLTSISYLNVIYQLILHYLLFYYDLKKKN